MARPDRHWWTELRRAATWHRRLVAASLAAIAVTFGLQVLRPPPPRTAEVLTAARDIDAGATLAGDDLVVVALPREAVPTGALGSSADAVGRAVASPIRSGEVLTDVRLVGPALVAGLAEGLVATPVRVADSGTASLVRPGDRVDVLATPVSPDSAGQPTRTVASNVVIVAVPIGDDAGFVEGALLVLATTSAEAAVLAHATVTDRLSITLRG